MNVNLSPRGQEALEWLKSKQAVLVTEVGSKEARDCFGNLEAPPVRVMNSLIKKGLAFITEENWSEFDWTPMYMPEDI